MKKVMSLIPKIVNVSFGSHLILRDEFCTFSCLSLSSETFPHLKTYRPFTGISKVQSTGGYVISAEKGEYILLNSDLSVRSQGFFPLQISKTERILANPSGTLMLVLDFENLLALLYDSELETVEIAWVLDDKPEFIEWLDDSRVVIAYRMMSNPNKGNVYVHSRLEQEPVLNFFAIRGQKCLDKKNSHLWCIGEPYSLLIYSFETRKNRS
jgi:hypothetical protein